MTFLVLEEKSFSTAMLFNSAPAFFASSSAEESGTWTREWCGKGAASGGSSWNHLGSICSVHPPRPSISPLQQEQMRPPKIYRTHRHIQREALKSQLSVHRKSLFSPLAQRWCVFGSARPMGIASHIGSEIIRLTQLNLLKSKYYFLRPWLGSSVTQSYLTLCDLMDCSTPGFPVLYQLPGLARSHVHRVGDTIQPSHPLLSPFLTALNLSQHQGLFQCLSFSHEVAKVLEFQLQHHSFQWVFRTDFL